MGTIAFFDLDRTLIGRNSAALWLREEILSRQVGLSPALRALLMLMRYRLFGSVAIEDAMLSGLVYLKGLSEREVRQRTEVFYARFVRDHLRPGGRRAVAEHRAAGDKLVLLTASSHYISELTARDLMLDDFLCTELEVDARGLFTGRALGRMCFGTGKLVAARAYAQRVGIELADCAFYTDSFSDLSTLAAVGRPVAVNPDLRLRREAMARGWPVVDWGRAEGPGKPR